LSRTIDECIDSEAISLGAIAAPQRDRPICGFAIAQD
jgi:hypothetical protein